MKICSFNPAGGFIVDENGKYGRQDIAYIVDLFRAIDPDILCLQETLVGDSLPEKESVTLSLSKALHLHYWEKSAGHTATHLRSPYELGMAILAKEPIIHCSSVVYPYPKYDLIWPRDKTKAGRHDKFLMRAQIGGLWVGNTQMLPLHLWGRTYEEADLDKKPLGEKIEQVLCAAMANLTNVILTGDFNVTKPAQVYAKLCEQLDLEASPSAMPTTIDGKCHDHFLYRRGLRAPGNSYEVWNMVPFDHFPIVMNLR